MNYVIIHILIASCFKLLPLILCREPPVIEIPEQGDLMGFYLKMFRTQKIVAYLGIPYAHPPIMEKRFSPPIVDKLPSWEGVRNATQVPFECWPETRKPIKQHDEIFFRMLGITTKTLDDPRFNEDCLFLNIHVPDGRFLFAIKRMI